MSGANFPDELRDALLREWADLQREHEPLRDWTLELSGDDAYWHPLGEVYFESRTLVLYPRTFIEAAAIDSLRHEAAHVLRGQPGHDAAWRRWAKRLGAAPKARYEGEAS